MLRFIVFICGSHPWGAEFFCCLFLNKIFIKFTFIVCRFLPPSLNCELHYILVTWKIYQNKVRMPGYRAQGLPHLGPLDLGQPDIGQLDSEHSNHWTWNNYTTGLGIIVLGTTGLGTTKHGITGLGSTRLETNGCGTTGLRAIGLWTSWCGTFGLVTTGRWTIGVGKTGISTTRFWTRIRTTRLLGLGPVDLGQPDVAPLELWHGLLDHWTWENWT